MIGFLYTCYSKIYNRYNFIKQNYTFCNIHSVRLFLGICITCILNFSILLNKIVYITENIMTTHFRFPNIMRENLWGSTKKKNSGLPEFIST